jgi:hypothetical protein
LKVILPLFDEVETGRHVFSGSSPETDMLMCTSDERTGFGDNQNAACDKAEQNTM